MAQQIISPGVFTRENDLSFLPQGIGAIGAAIVGPTVKGPAFIPTVVNSFAEFERRFGPLSSDTYVPQTVREYLKNAGSVTVCRVLAGGGYTYTQGTNGFIGLIAETSGSERSNIFLGAIFPSKNSTGTPGLDESTLDMTPGSEFLDDNFSLILTGSNVSSTQYSGSVNPSNANYIFKQLGYSADNSKTGANTFGSNGYTYVNWKGLQSSIQSSAGEVTEITFAASISTASLSNVQIAASGAFYITTSGSTQSTVFFTGSAGGPPTTPLTATSGSLVGFTAASSGDPAVSTGAQLATGFMTAINTISGLTASIDSSNTAKVVVTQTEASDVLDISTTFAAATASVSVVTQGTAGLSGYHLSSTGTKLKLVKQVGSGTVQFKGGPGLTTTTEGYGYASTPMITSQFVGGTHPNKTTKELFAFHTLDHGKHLCHDYKISIANLREPGDINGVEQYSQFSVLVRKANDTDKSPLILEQFNNVTLDPDSARYIARVIGDRYPQYNETLNKVEMLGDYPNISKYIRVEVAAAVASKSTSAKLSPKGFKALYNPIPSASLDTNCTIPSASFEGEQVIGSNYSAKGFLGFKFMDKAADNENFLNPIPTILENNVSGDFNVENHSGHASSSLWVGSLSASVSLTGTNGPTANQLKFTVPFQGGDDGIAPYQIKNIGEYITAGNLYGFDMNGTTSIGYKAYKKAIDILSNQDEYDINMLALPGVIKSLHSATTDAAIDMCEERGDTFYVMDLSSVDATVNTAVSDANGIDTNYAAVYYPWVKVLDSSINKPVLVPPSVIVPGAIAASDRIGFEWFAPAGLNRGILGNVIEAKIRLNQAERDTLYDNKINPIATFPQTGVCIWGQKTLQERSTALDRINVRRLLIAVKKFIASSSRYLVFEQNTLQTRQRFLNIVNPYLESIQQNQGLFAFRVQMDESNNTPAEIDRNELVGAIYLQPTKTAEYIILDFNVLPTGASFDGSGGGTSGGGGSTGGGGGY